MPLPTVVVEVALIGMSVESSVESVLDKPGDVIKTVVLVVELTVDVPIKAVKTQTKLLRWDEIHIHNKYIQSWNTSFKLHSVPVSLLHVIQSDTPRY